MFWCLYVFCRARIQIKKEEEELNRAFGSGPIERPKPQPYKGPRAPKGTAQLTGPAAAPAAAVAAAGAAAEGAADGEDADGEEQQQRRMTTVEIFGDSKAVEKAVAMIEEAVANKEQKAKQRQAQYDRKRDQKRRDRCAQCCCDVDRLVMQSCPPATMRVCCYMSAVM
jgi:hypothetical protein